MRFTINIAVAGQAGLLIRHPVVVFPAALAMGPISVVSAAHTAPPTAGAAVLLHVKHAFICSPAAVTPCERGEGRRERERAKGQVRGDVESEERDVAAAGGADKAGR